MSFPFRKFLKYQKFFLILYIKIFYRVDFNFEAIFNVIEFENLPNFAIMTMTMFNYYVDDFYKNFDYSNY